MDEFQFIESLDALLANEAIDDTTTAAAELANTSLLPVHGQGILSGPTGPGLIAESNSSTWLGGNDNNLSRSDPFAMPLHSNAGVTSVSTTSSVGSSTFPQYSNGYTSIEQQPRTGANATQKGLGPILPSASPVVPMSSSTQRTIVSTATNAAPSGVESVCSGNSRGSSNASSSRRRGSGRSCNNSTTSVGSAASPGGKGTKPASRKRIRGGTSMAVSDSEDESSRRRHDRNLREQRRSQKITNQIDQLREVLAAASVRFKPDKYSTLVSVVEYVKQLQRRSSMLDMEHKKLLDTITRTNEIVNEPYLANTGTSASSTTGSTRSSNHGGMGTNATKPDSALSNGVGGNENATGVAAGGDIYNDDELVFVRNIDYKLIFERCGMPLAVASIDGRLIDCNEEFVKLTGYRREELLPNEKHQNQRRQQELQQQGSAIISDDVRSSFLPGSVFPDGPTSSSSNNDNRNVMMNKEPDAHSGRETSETRNFSLFNLLSRNNMEEVFVSLSEMLKQPPAEENGVSSVSKSDYWSGNVRLSRNTHLEVSGRSSNCFIFALSFFAVHHPEGSDTSAFLFAFLYSLNSLRCE